MDNNLEDNNFLDLDYDDFIEKIKNTLKMDRDEKNFEYSPLAIDAAWGCGKSTFCDRLIDNITNDSSLENINCIKVDMFEAERTDNPLLTLFVKLLVHFDKDSKLKTKVKEVKRKVLPCIKYFTQLTLKAGVNYVVREILGDLQKDITNIGKEASDVVIDNLFNEEMEKEKNLEAFKVVLDDLTKENGNIIFFLDELDRCKPSYALSVLEMIKHVFNVPRIQFVLFINQKQIEASINKEYGQDIDAEEYLDKFIKMRYALPNAAQQDYAKKQHNSYIYCAKLFSKMNKSTEFVYVDSHKNTYHLYKPLDEIFNAFIANYQLSLRQIERIVGKINLYINSKSYQDYNQLCKYRQNGKAIYLSIIILLGCFLLEIERNIVRKLVGIAIDDELLRKLDKKTIWAIETELNNLKQERLLGILFKTENHKLCFTDDIIEKLDINNTNNTNNLAYSLLIDVLRYF